MIGEPPPTNDRFTMIDLLLRIGVTGNLVLISLTWWPRFSGTERQAGLADEFFGQFTIGGFRIDFVWLVASSAAFLFAGFYFFKSNRESRTARINGILCVIGVLAFVVYMLKLLTSGLLYFD